MIWLTLLLACGGKHVEAPPEPVEPEHVEAPAPPPPPAPTGWVGQWSSPSCGEKRTYERRLSIVEGGTWTASDRVSPCPEGARCVWSGIIDRSGTWAEAGEGIALSSEAEPDTRGAPMPTAIARTAEGLMATEGDQSCLYTAR